MSFLNRKKERVPSYMQPTKSSSKKTRDKISNACVPRRLSAGLGSASFGDAHLRHPQQEPVRKPPSVCDMSIPRYMQPTESSASTVYSVDWRWTPQLGKMHTDKYKLRAPSPCVQATRPKERRKSVTPQLPPTVARRNAMTPNREIVRVQMSNMAMNSFVESLRSSTPYYDNVAKQVEKMRSHSRQRKIKDCDVPRYQQGTVVSSLRTTVKDTRRY